MVSTRGAIKRNQCEQEQEVAQSCIESQRKKLPSRHTGTRGVRKRNVPTTFSAWKLWDPKTSAPGPVFEDVNENAEVLFELTKKEYVRLSRRQKVGACTDTYSEQTDPKLQRECSRKDDESDSLELLLIDSLQEDEVSQKPVSRREAPQTRCSGKGIVQKDQSIYLALRTIGFDSWRHFVDTVLHTPGAGLPGSKKRSKKSPGEVTLSDVLNGTSPYYHPGFARSYQKIRKLLRDEAIKMRDIETLKHHSSLTLSWSNLTAEEHSWYLVHQHQKLSGADARRFEHLHRRVLQENERYLDELRLHAEHHRSRYEHMTERQNAQLFSDDERMRDRIHQLFPKPSLFHVDTVEIDDLVSDQGSFKFISVLHVKGNPLKAKKLTAGHILPGDKHYLPAIATLNTTRGIYKKEVTPEIHSDPIVKEILASSEITKEITSYDKFVLVATAGAFRGILASDLMGQKAKDLELPITYSQEQNMTVCYLGKPLMQKSLMSREKQARLQKYAVLSASMDAPNRQAIYSLWKHSSTGICCIVRSHSAIVCSDVPSVFGVKPEYLPEPDREKMTVEEVSRWKSALCLGYPSGARHVQVAHVCTPRGTILSWSALKLEDLEQMYPSPKSAIHSSSPTAMEFESISLNTFLHWASESLVSLKDRDTLLAKLCTTNTSENTKKRWNVYSIQESRLQRGERNMENGTKEYMPPYDIHAAHRTSTSTDVLSSPWVPPIWRPYTDTIAQIPYTYPPYCVKTGEKASAVPMPRRKRVRRVPWKGDLDRPNMVSDPDVDQGKQASRHHMKQYLQELLDGESINECIDT